MARVSVKVPSPTTPLVQPVSSPAAAVRNRSRATPWLAGLAILILIGFIIVVIILLSQRNHLQSKVNTLSTTTTGNSANSDVQKYQAEVGKLVELPVGKTPSVVPVKDAAKLAADNPFFKRAENGDVVLLYILDDKSVTAILYRPTDHKVVEATSSASIGGGTATGTGQ